MNLQNTFDNFLFSENLSDSECDMFNTDFNEHKELLHIKKFFPKKEIKKILSLQHLPIKSDLNKTDKKMSLYKLHFTDDTKGYIFSDVSLNIGDNVESYNILP